MLVATLLITVEILVPTLVNAAIAATAISEAIKVYSMAVAPCSFFIRRRKMDSICISKEKAFFDRRFRRPLVGSGDRRAIGTDAGARNRALPQCLVEICALTY